MDEPRPESDPLEPRADGDKAERTGAEHRERISEADRQDESTRLRTLDQLYERLERELEGDLDQEKPPGR